MRHQTALSHGRHNGHARHNAFAKRIVHLRDAAHRIRGKTTRLLSKSLRHAKVKTKKLFKRG